MINNSKDGIRFENTVYVIDEKSAGYPYTMRIFQYLAILAVSWSAVSILQDSFLIQADKIILYFVLWLAVTVFYGLFLIPSYDLVKLFFLCLFYGLFFYSRWERILNGFYILENLIIHQIGAYFELNLIYFKADYTATVADITLLIIMIIIPVILLTVIAVQRISFIGVCSAIYFIPVAGSFVVGIIPDDGKMLLFLISIVYLIRGSGTRRHFPDQSQKTRHQIIRYNVALALSILSLVLYGILRLFITHQEYNDVTRIKEMKSGIQTYLDHLSLEDVMNQISLFPFRNANTAVGGLSGGKLGRVDEIEYTQKEQMKVIAPIDPVRDGIYLKGYVGCEYTGNSWDGYDKEMRKKYAELLKKFPEGIFSPINQNKIYLDNLIKNNRYSVQDDNEYSDNSYGGILRTQNQYYTVSGLMMITNLNPNDNYLYLPYGIDANALSEISYEQDLYIRPSVRKNNYMVQFDYDLNLAYTLSGYYDLSGSFGDYAYYEKIYRDYVYSVYTRLPQKGLDQLKKDFVGRNHEKELGDIIEKINDVRDYLWSNTTYTLSPGKLPKGKDFVEYFLYENKKGYCAHYASAATLMLRAMGVPARYVEGYAAGIKDISNENMGDQLVAVISDQEIRDMRVDQVELSVKDSNAHAWVEVYMDSFGWVPIEFTPGAVENNLTTDAFGDMLKRGDAINESITPNRPQVTATVAPTQAPRELTPTISPNPNNKKRDEEGGNNLPLRDNIIMYLLLFLFIIICTAVFLNKRRKLYGDMNENNKRAIQLFHKTEKILWLSRALPQKQRSLEDHIDHVMANCAYIEEESFLRFVETAFRARFGKGDLTSGDLERLGEYHRNLYQRIYRKLPFPKKIVCKIITLL